MNTSIQENEAIKSGIKTFDSNVNGNVWQMGISLPIIRTHNRRNVCLYVRCQQETLTATATTSTPFRLASAAGNFRTPLQPIVVVNADVIAALDIAAVTLVVRVS